MYKISPSSGASAAACRVVTVTTYGTGVGTMSMDSMGRVGSTGSTYIEDKTDMLPSFGDEAVGPPVDENGLVEDS